MWPTARAAREAMHLNVTANTKRMLPFRIFRSQFGKQPARTKGELDASGDATSWTGEVLPVTRHRLMTGETPGVLLRLILAAFGF